MSAQTGLLKRPASVALRVKASIDERLALRSVPPATRRLALSVRQQDLTYCTPAQLSSLVRLCAAAERWGQPGTIIEAGCARGGSALLLCAVKSRLRPLEVYDVFGMIPPPSPHDGPDLQARYNTIAAGEAVSSKGGKYYAYEDDLQEQVARTFEAHGYPLDDHNVRLIKGKVEETMTVTEPVCLAHIDVDWHEPVLHCLEQITPKLTAHGSIVVHAYNDWTGCRTATDEYFSRLGHDGFLFDDSARHLVVTRRGA